MAKDAYIAIWHLNTRVDTAGGVPVTDKLRDLRAKLVAADQAFSRLGAQPGDIQLFAAPEYYFAKSGDKILGYSAAEKDQIKQGVLQLSATYPDVVLIPGTVAWKEPLNRADRATTAQVTTAILATRRRGGYRGGTGVGTTDQARKNRFGLQKPTKMRWFGYNSAYVYSAGVLVGELNKSVPFFEFSGEDPDDKIVMIPGFTSGAMTMPVVDGTTPGQRLTVGVEVCADHGPGRLANCSGGRVDIHVLVSATQIAQHPAAREGGLFVHADSNKPPAVYPVKVVGNFHEKDRTKWSAASIIDDGVDLWVCKARLQ
jgi:hypothetical protein